MLLIIDKSKKKANSTAEIFRYMGVVARAETHENAFAEISLLYRAILLTSPELIPDLGDFIRKLREYASSIPIFIVSDKEYSGKFAPDAIIDTKTTSAMLIKRIIEFCDTNGLVPPGEYKLAGLDASPSLGCVTYYSQPIPLTKTESMILRVLMRAYPIPLTPRSILKYAFAQSRLPDVTGIRTHVSAINRKFRDVEGRRLIISDDSRGYVILTPLLLRDLVEKNGEEYISAIK